MFLLSYLLSLTSRCFKRVFRIWSISFFVLLLGLWFVLEQAAEAMEVILPMFGELYFQVGTAENLLDDAPFLRLAVAPNTLSCSSMFLVLYFNLSLSSLRRRPQDVLGSPNGNDHQTIRGALK